MPGLKQKEIIFLTSNGLCRLATASRDFMPHVAPVIYVVDGENIIVGVGYGTKKLRSLRVNPRVSLVLDS